MNSADRQQRSDASSLLPIAIREREEYVKLYVRLQNNITQFVDRSNHELAALALAIKQKDENIGTLKKMVDGYFVEPSAPVAARPSEPEPKEEAPPAPPPKRRANGVPPVVVTKKVDDDAKESPKP